MRTASTQPLTAFTCLPALRTDIQRDHVLRVAFFAAARSNRKAALDAVPLVIDKPWAGEVGFPNALEIAKELVQTSPENARKLLLAATRQNPSLALRSFRDYIDEFPFGQAIFDQAVSMVPGEAAGVCTSPTRTGQLMCEALRKSELPWMRKLLEVIGSESLDTPTKLRVAALAPVLPKVGLERAVAASQSTHGYFRMLLQWRAEAPGIERALQTFCQVQVRDIRDSGLATYREDLQRFTGKDLYQLLTIGREELNKETFTPLFEQLLAPRLKKEGLAGILPDPQLRSFLWTVMLYEKTAAFEALLPKERRVELWKRAMLGIAGSPRPLAEVISAAEIVYRTVNPQYLAAMAGAIETEHAKDPALYGLLAARLSPRLPERKSLASIAAPYSGYFHEPRTFETASIFNGARTAVQRYFFYNDDDGVESFQVFRKNYERTPGWKFENHGDWVRIASTGKGRKIEMFANVPFDAVRGGSAAVDRQMIVTREMGILGLEPNVVVHRGHAYHLEKTLSYLTPAAKLVYLGSCWGMESVDRVIQGAWSAQLIATQGTGSHTINDPLLKALNEEFLKDKKRLDWPSFWSAQQAHLGKNPLFQDYVPPHRNTAAILLTAYYAYLADNSQ